MDSRFAFDRPAHKPMVRLAGAGDIEGMARVSVDTWRLTYGGILPAGYLARMRLSAHETQRRRLMASPGAAHFVAEEPVTGETVGFASAGPARGADGGITAEIYELYVQNGFQRQGLGRGLVLAARAWLAGEGHGAMIVWVLAKNPARSFYERLGGHPAGQRTIRVGGALVDEAAYVWRELAGPIH
jgi:GNAT superfamily N-acetyltransferase